MGWFAWLGIVAAFCLPQTVQRTSETATIVIVVEDQSGAVVQAAHVRIQPLPQNTAADLTTDANGKLSLTLPVGSYDLVAIHFGFNKLEKHVVVGGGEPETVHLRLEVGSIIDTVPMPSETADEMTTESVFPNVLSVSFPEASECPSPDKRYVIVGVDSDREPYHTVFLRDKARGAQRKLFTYGRSVALLWNANSTTFAVTDHVGSDTSQVSVYSVDERRAPVRVLDLLFGELPESARKTLKAELTNHHVYIEASAWVAPTVLSVEVWGYRDANPKGFKRFYQAKLPDSWTSQ